MGDCWGEKGLAWSEVFRGTPLPWGRCLIPSLGRAHKSYGKPPVGTNAVDPRNHRWVLLWLPGRLREGEDSGMAIFRGLEIRDEF